MTTSSTLLEIGVHCSHNIASSGWYHKYSHAYTNANSMSLELKRTLVKHIDSLYIISTCNFLQMLGRLSSSGVHIHYSFPFTIENFCRHSTGIGINLFHTCLEAVLPSLSHRCHQSRRLKPHQDWTVEQSWPRGGPSHHQWMELLWYRWM